MGRVTEHTAVPRRVERFVQALRYGKARLWLGLLAGLAGLAALVTAELTAGQTGRGPAVRYMPPDLSGTGAVAVNPPVTFIVHPTVEGLQAAFKSAHYDLDDVRTKRKRVPRLRLLMLPRNLPELADVERRKTVFLSLMLPLVLEANAHVAIERRRLHAAIERREAGQALSADFKDWISELAKRYKVSPGRLRELLLRVDTVPPSLALAQAAVESGWGTSRFAMKGNAIFGQWTTAGGTGMVPRERPEGESYKIRTFDRLMDSVNAYMRNLNTHPSYRRFRELRAAMRKKDRPLDSIALAGNLRPYSETGEDYVALVREIIRNNRLAPLDKAVLGDSVIEFAWGV